MRTNNAALPMFDWPLKPSKLYTTLVADPPWGYRDKLGGPQERGAEGHYETMSMEKLHNMPVPLWAAEDSCLWLWTTNAFMVEAHQLARAWGFEPRTILTWVKGRLDIEGHAPVLKQHIGMGHFLRNSTEHVLFCVRGSIDVRQHDVPSAFIAPRLEHSEKPAAFYDIMASLTPGPYLDVFARKQRWVGSVELEVMDTFGNETYNFGTDQPADAYWVPPAASPGEVNGAHDDAGGRG